MISLNLSLEFLNDLEDCLLTQLTNTTSWLQLLGNYLAAVWILCRPYMVIYVSSYDMRCWNQIVSVYNDVCNIFHYQICCGILVWCFCTMLHNSTFKITNSTFLPYTLYEDLYNWQKTIFSQMNFFNGLTII